MRTAQELRTLLNSVHLGYGQMSLLRELAEDLIARREAEEEKAVTIEAEALRARVFAQCRVDVRRGGEFSDTTLTHLASGLSATAARRDDALDTLITALRAHGALPS